jgi:nucleotide-binding universal stress UspA family protein
VGGGVVPSKRTGGSTRELRQSPGAPRSAAPGEDDLGVTPGTRSHRVPAVSEPPKDADLLVVGNRGPAGIAGRLLGSVPAGATRRSQRDVLVVHTTG